MCKEKLRLNHYTRYMDDFAIIHENKVFLRRCMLQMYEYAERECSLTFNEKTQIFPPKNGVEYLGFRFVLSDSGAVVRRLKTSSKLRYEEVAPILGVTSGGTDRGIGCTTKPCGFSGALEAWGYLLAAKESVREVCFVEGRSPGMKLMI